MILKRDQVYLQKKNLKYLNLLPVLVLFNQGFDHHSNLYFSSYDYDYGCDYDYDYGYGFLFWALFLGRIQFQWLRGGK